MHTTSPHRARVVTAVLVAAQALVGAGCGSSSKSAQTSVGKVLGPRFALTPAGVQVGG